MKHLLIALSLAAVANLSVARSAHPAAPAASEAASATTVATATATQPGTPQRSKMKACNVDAKTKSLHGDDRRAFMKQCLSGKARPAIAS